MNSFKKLLLIILIFFTSEDALPQVHFVGLTNVVGNKIDVIFRSENYGNIHVNDTLYLFDVSSQHLYIVKRILTDSIQDKNFIGGEYEDDRGNLTYFNKRLVANYLKTIPYGNYLLSREIGDFFCRSNYFLCLKLQKPVQGIDLLRQNKLNYNSTTYDFIDKIIVSNNDKKKYSLEKFYGLKIKAENWADLIILEDERKETHIRIFINSIQIADILVRINNN